MSLKSKTIIGVKWTTFSTIVLALVGIIKISVLARFLDAADFGLMALVTFLLGFMDLFMDMGLTSAILHRQEISKNEYASLYWINIIFSFILFALISLSSPLIGAFYNESQLLVLIPIMAISIMLSALGRQFKTIEQKQLNFKYIAITNIVGAAIGLIVSIVAAMKGFGVYALVYGALVQYAISNGIYFVNGLRVSGLIFRFKYLEIKPFLKIGIFQVGGQVANYFNRDLDILLIGKLFGSEILGAYSLAKQLVQRPMQISNPIISNVASPVLAILQKDKEQLKDKFLVIVNMVATINFVAYALLAIMAYPVVFILYGKEYLEIVVLVQILSIYMFLRSVGNPVGSLLTATGRTDLDFNWNLFALFISPIAIYIGAHHSIEMVALSLLTASIILLYPFWRLLIFKLCGASFSEYIICFVPKWRKISLFLKSNY
jgi:O-antigen/teichoic acid export membrane protein